MDYPPRYLIQRIAEKCRDLSSSGDEVKVLNELIKLVTKLQSSDLNFNINVYKFDLNYPALHVTPIYFDSDMTITLYVLKGNALIPIHDHPNMISLVRVLEGKLQISGYSRVDSSNAAHTLNVRSGVVRVLGNAERPYVTTPTKDNFHSLRAIGGPAAYVDILVPPFEPGVRDRNQYELVNHQRGLEKEMEYLTLRKIDLPPIDIREIEYRGPRVKLASAAVKSEDRNGTGNDGQNGGRVYMVVCPNCSTEISWKPARE